MTIPLIMPARAPCPGHTEGCSFESLGASEDRSGKVGETEVLRCRHCGIGVTMPPLLDVAFLYEGRESDDFQPQTRGLATAIKRLAFRRQVRQLLRQRPVHTLSCRDAARHGRDRQRFS
jgi:hypothetical protein